VELNPTISCLYGVGADDLTKIDCALEEMGIHNRMTQYTDENLCIVKPPTAEHEAAHLSL